MDLPYIENGKLFKPTGRVIEKPSILIIEGKFVAYGTEGYLKFKSELEKKNLLSRGKSLMEINIIALHKYLCIEDCLEVISICLLGSSVFDGCEESYNNFISRLCKIYSRRNLRYFVSNLKLSI